MVFGKITDAADGKPVQQVQVIAHCGNGTLLPTGSTMTDANGEYQLLFGPGMRMGRGLGVGPFGVGLQAATISARKPGYFAHDLGRSGNLGMTDSTNAKPAWVTNFSGVVRALAPYQLDFRLKRAALLRGHVEAAHGQLPLKTSLCLKGEKLPPSSSVLACVDLGENGEFQFADVPVGFPFWFEVSWREKDSWKTLCSAPVTAASSTSRKLRIFVRDDTLEWTESPP